MSRSVAAWVFGTLLACPGVAFAAKYPSPLEGIFESCPLDGSMQTCTHRLDLMRQGGVQVVVIAASGASMASLQNYADAAQSRGMFVMWEISDPGWWQQPPTSDGVASTFPAFASACGCDQSGTLLAYMVSWLGSLPGTYGYYAVDDWMLGPDDEAGVATYVRRIKQRDSTHTIMIGSGDQSETDTYQPISDVIGTMIYPVTTDRLTPLSANLATWRGVAESATEAQRSGDTAGKESAFILQAFTWGDNIDDGIAIGACSPTDDKWTCYRRLRYPAAAEQRELRDVVLRHSHPKLVLWWSFPATYGQIGADTYSIYPTGSTASSRWRGLAGVIKAPQPKATDQHRVRTHA
jgi:hypothetical protein